jgi:hypothetical protein
MKVLIKKQKKTPGIRENRSLGGLEELIEGLFPDNYKNSFFGAMADGYNECGAAKVAMATHRGDL